MTDDQEMRLRTLEAGAPITEVLAFYDGLPPATIAQMIGAWRGAGVPTGHALDGMLEQIGWHGKRFESAEDGHPLVFEQQDGTLFCVNPSRLPIGMVLDHAALARSTISAALFRASSSVLSTSKPQARLRMTEYRGVVSASMIYDGLPIIDVFRSVGPDTLIGAMDMRGMEQPFMFTLRREPS
ncbi:DUF4334 domain-containing protein [Martelella limonii]|uniref:DUF4334 domain-containing protein n=1 Tax=Martelella limonii TaxID=1647649 RepID=UPI00158078DD|nr:DUF4334 domain-containing protein [Martelella limonii]